MLHLFCSVLMCVDVLISVAFCVCDNDAVPLFGSKSS